MTHALRFRKPMLAKNFESHQKRVVFPCFAQPKLDGIRCITDGQRFWSKNGKLFPQENFKHLRMAKPFPHLLDGELMAHDGMDFEEIVSIVKRAGHESSSSMFFHAFDVMTDQPYVIRRAQLRSLFERAQIRTVSERWVRLIAPKIERIDDLYSRFDEYLERQYEGMMVRNAAGLYVPKRTHDLLKWKPLQDAEFLICEVVEAKGKDRGTPIFICRNPEDHHAPKFRVRPMGTMDQRRRMWRDRGKLVGKLLTVEFQNLTRYGVPRFPRAKVLRDYE